MAINKRSAVARVVAPFRSAFGAGFHDWTARTLNPRRKLYIPREIGVVGFFRALNDAGAQHVVLRWFEDLPYIEPGHDLDFLVSDAAIETVQGLLSEWPDGQKVDFYSESGLHGSGYMPSKLHDVPAFPPHVAADLLASAQPTDGGWSIPDDRTHFLGLAYHAVYLKGDASGLPRDENTPALRKGSHDYASVLTDLGRRAGFELEQPVTMASLNTFLRSQGWAPDDDHLRALAPINSWITPPP